MDDRLSRRAALRTGCLGCIAGLAGCLTGFDGTDGTTAESDAATADEEWPTLRANPRRTAANLGSDGPDETASLSAVTTWESSFARPPLDGISIRDGVVYVTGRTLAATALDGSERWEFAPDVETSDGEGAGGQTHGHPAVLDGTVYIGGSGTVSAVEASSGQADWTVRIAPSDTEVDTYAVTDRGVFVTFPGDEPTTTKLRRDDGTTVWRRNVGGHLVPAVTDDVVIVGDRTTVYALSLESGETLWTRSLDSRHVMTPLVSEETVVVADDTTLFGLSLPAGTVRWRVRRPPRTSNQPAAANGRVYVPQENVLAAVSLADGELVWERELDLQPSTASPVVAADGLYTFAGERLFHLNVENGETVYATTVSDRPAPYWYSVANGHLYTLTTTRHLDRYYLRAV